MIDIAKLQTYSLFGGLTEADLGIVKPYLCGASYEAGDDIIREGQTNGRIHFLVEGRVEVRRRDRRLVELAEGDAFGEVEVLDVRPAVASIRALTPARVLYLSNHNLHEVYKTDARVFAMLVMNLARELARRLRRMDELLCPEPGAGETT
ncbi:MAG TPA: cyclic nucleotide-binding domain-containing protein [Spirochaetales bacterium]|nr:cyclic nucleotide-binding domain-containing protein [Spirochaetia bacterium]HPE36587.1 cyclic nucleotide-binding domain-containing protein [Spirochaetales bacterium]